MSGIKHAKPFNFGFMAGVRQLRDEEYADQYKPSLKPPGSSNFLRVAQEQFNMEAEGEGHSGYMAEEPGNTPAWRKTPDHLKKLRLPTLLYDGTEADDPRDSYEVGIGGKWAAKMRKYGKVGNHILPGYDGAISAFHSPGGGEEDAAEGEHEVVVESSPEMAAAIKAEKAAARRNRVLRLAKAGSASTVSEGAPAAPSVGGAHSSASGLDPRAGSWASGSVNSARLSQLKTALYNFTVSVGKGARSARGARSVGGASTSE